MINPMFYPSWAISFSLTVTVMPTIHKFSIGDTISFKMANDNTALLKITDFDLTQGYQIRSKELSLYLYGDEAFGWITQPLMEKNGELWIAKYNNYWNELNE